MIMQCSVRAVGLAGRRRDVPGGWKHHVGTRAGNTSGAQAAQRLPSEPMDAIATMIATGPSGQVKLRLPP